MIRYAAKTGKNIELVSYHFDHKVGRSILGNCYLQLGYHNGINFYPLDVALNHFHATGRVQSSERSIKEPAAGKDEKKLLDKKTTALLQMVDRAWHAGIDASFVLFDSWFAHDDIIQQYLLYRVRCDLSFKKRPCKIQLSRASNIRSSNYGNR